MAWVGQRVVTDVRNALYSHILGQSASFFAERSTGELMSRVNNDVSQVQQAVSETAGDLARETLALVGFALLLFYYDAWLADLLHHQRAADCLSAGATRSARAAHDPAQPGSVAGAVAHQRRRRSPATASSRHSGTSRSEADRFARAGHQLFRTNMKVTAALSSLPPLMELLGGFGMAGALWYGSREIASGRLTIGELTSFIATLFLMYGPGEEAQSGQREPAAGHRRVGAHLRDARHAHRGRREAGRAAAAAVHAVASSSAT